MCLKDETNVKNNRISINHNNHVSVICLYVLIFIFLHLEDETTFKIEQTLTIITILVDIKFGCL